jgi:ABC-type transporter Mla MlaB component
MLKITIHDVKGPLRLQLEGRLAGVWVRELEHCWRTAKVQHPQRACAVDLTGVTFVDQAGRYLLQLMHRDGIVKLLGMIVSPGSSRHIPDAIATDPTLRRPAPYP